jgi:hypothetical protein
VEVAARLIVDQLAISELLLVHIALEEELKSRLKALP